MQCKDHRGGPICTADGAPLHNVEPAKASRHSPEVGEACYGQHIVPSQQSQIRPGQAPPVPRLTLA